MADSLIGSNVHDSGRAVSPGSDVTSDVDDATFEDDGRRDSDFDPGDSFNVLGELFQGTGTINSVRTDGQLVTVIFAADRNFMLGSFNGCVVAGVAYAG